MKTLLLIHSSSRSHHSVTRKLTTRFARQWSAANSGGKIIERDIGLRPPPSVDEAWITAAFDPNGFGAPALAASDELIAELVTADVIVMGVPMYNFGMPAQMKAYFDQIVRVGVTFNFDPAAENPYTSLLDSKPVIAILSTGDGALHMGGPLAHLNFLEPHLATILGFVGLVDFTPVRVGYDEYQDDRTKRSLAEAEKSVDLALHALMS